MRGRRRLPEAREPYLLWLGGIFDHETMLRRPGVNPAGRRTQRDMVKALGRQHVQVRTLGHAPESLWPKGRMRDRGADPLEPGIVGDTVAYWNLPGLRARSIERAYLRAFDRIVKRHGAPALVLSYNAYPYNVGVGVRAQAMGIPWVSIVADVPQPGREREAHDEAVNRAAGRVFYSWSEFQDARHRAPKLHMDHGVDALYIEEPHADEDARRRIVYTGSMGRWAGVDLLLDAFRGLSAPAVELVICGHGSNPAVDRASAEDPRVHFLGLVSEERLHEVCRSAAVFVNPRPSNVPGNEGNFPSKLLEYLKYGKPIVSTWTPGLAPEYASLLHVVREETPQALADSIRAALALDADARRDLSHRIGDFLVERKLWDVHAVRLLEWLRAEVGVPLGAPAAAA